MKKHIVVIGIIVLFLGVGFSGCNKLSQNPFIADLIQKIDEDEIYRSIYSLQNFTTRYYGTLGNKEASTWIYNKLKNISGLFVEYHGGDLRNVIATLPGSDPTSSNIYMVGAHYDTVNLSFAPGATDNGGGVAIVLELARIMSQYTWNHTVLFALWNTEESGPYLKGSVVYIEYVVANNINISLYINFDSACYDPDNHFILDIVYNKQSQWVSEMMTRHNYIYNIGFTLTYNVHHCWSDHIPFWENNYTAVMTHQETHGPGHTSFDTIDKVSTLYAKKNGQLGLSVLATLAGTDLPSHQ
jgi:Zn-dependent M28 family amino/carboxypeptidase